MTVGRSVWKTSNNANTRVRKARRSREQNSLDGVNEGELLKERGASQNLNPRGSHSKIPSVWWGNCQVVNTGGWPVGGLPWNCLYQALEGSSGAVNYCAHLYDFFWVYEQTYVHVLCLHGCTCVEANPRHCSSGAIWSPWFVVVVVWERISYLYVRLTNSRNPPIFTSLVLTLQGHATQILYAFRCILRNLRNNLIYL